MSRKCNICNRSDRGEIENAILNMTSATDPAERASLNDIAEEFDLTSKDAFNELKMHALFHMPLVTRSILNDGEAASSTNTTSTELKAYKFQPDGSLERDPSADQLIDNLGPQFEPGAVIDQVRSGRMSLAQKMKLHEADMLTAVNHEYLVTLKAIGRRMNRLAQVSDIAGEDDDAALRTAKWMTKPMVELYLGLGAEIRKNVATLTDVNQVLNGPADQGANGLAALAAAIRSSSNVNQED